MSFEAVLFKIDHPRIKYKYVWSCMYRIKEFQLIIENKDILWRLNALQKAIDGLASYNNCLYMGSDFEIHGIMYFILCDSLLDESQLEFIDWKNSNNPNIVIHGHRISKKLI